MKHQETRVPNLSIGPLEPQLGSVQGHCELEMAKFLSTIRRRRDFLVNKETKERIGILDAREREIKINHSRCKRKRD